MTSPKELRGGRYVLVRTLGEGSQGETWEAIDRGTERKLEARPSLADAWKHYVAQAGEAGTARPPKVSGERVVAIKCFRLGKAKAWKDVELAEREARTLASLDHPRLPRYHAHFEEDGALYLVMEKIEGESLAAIRARGGSLSPEEVRRMLSDAAEALGYLHGCAPAIVHRDIKPGNVIRRPDGSFSIVDFGSVRDRLKPAGGSTVVGTFGYMAPEQFQGRASTTSDVYGVGATALAMLTGCEPEELPHEGLGIAVQKAVPPGTPPGLVRALEAMLQPDPDRRVASVAEALALLDRPARPRSRKDAKKARQTLPRVTTKKEARRLARAAQKVEREAERARRAPLVPRLVGRFGLLVALLAVWLVVGVITPSVLVLLSLVFGPALIRAARALVKASRRAEAAIGRSSAWLSGRRIAERAGATTSGSERHVRIADDALASASAEAPPGIAEEEAEDADAWLEDRVEREARRVGEEESQRRRMQLHARPPPKRKYWGR